MSVALHHISKFASRFLLVVVMGAASAAHAQSIAGVVTDVDRTVLPSKVVAAYAPDPTCSTKRVVCWKNVANVTTDALGRYSIDSVAAGSYRVLAYDPTGVFATQFSGGADSFDVTPLTVVAGSQAQIVNFTLEKGSAISGIALTSGGTRRDIVVAAYNVSGTRRGFAKTDANGLFSMTVPAGTYKLVAYDESGTFASAFFRDQVDFATANAITAVAGRPVTGIDFFLPIAARFFGVVRDSSGVPIDGATVYAYGSSGTLIASVYTASDGTFSISVPGGTYRFAAGDESGLYAGGFPADALSFDASPALNVSGGQSRNDLTFRLQVAGRISGLVTDARTGASLAGMTVAAYNADGSLRASVTTDSAGHYDLLLPTASFAIGAWDNSLTLAPQFYALRRAYRYAIPVASTPGASVVLQPFALHEAGRISGTVRAQNGSPVAKMVVAAYDSDGATAGSAVTNSVGAYRMALDPGMYRLLAYDPEVQFGVSYDRGTNFDNTPPRTVSAGTELTVDFTATRGTRVTGAIVDSAGRPVSGAEVNAFASDGGHVASARTIEDGSFELALVPGLYRFGVRDPAGRYPAAYLGGTSLPTATLVTVSATGAPQINVTLRVITHRRAVGR